MVAALSDRYKNEFAMKGFYHVSVAELLNMGRKNDIR